MGTVVLVDPVEVRGEAEEEFLRNWDSSTEFLSAQPGFIGAYLTRSVGVAGAVSFVSYSEWESPRAFLAGATRAESQEVREAAHGSHPALYQTVRTVRPDSGGRSAIAAA